MPGVLPDHLHCAWTLPPGDDVFSTRWRLIKTIFARSLAAGAGFILSTGSDGRNKADPPTQPENDSIRRVTLRFELPGL
jgi:REP element-mobilizing transposase RayT